MGIRFDQTLAHAARILAASCLIVGIVPLHARELQRGEPVELQHDEGILAVVTNAPTFVDSLRFERVGSLIGGENLRPTVGRSVQLLALPAGDYRLRHVNLWGGNYLELGDKDLYAFHVEADAINYPGDFDVGNPANSWRSYIGLNRINRGALMMVALDEVFPGLRKRLRVRFEGAYPDRFPAFLNERFGDDSLVDAFRTKTTVTDDAADKAKPELRTLVNELFQPAQISGLTINPSGDLIAMSERVDKKHYVSVLDIETMKLNRIASSDFDVDQLIWGDNRELLVAFDTASGGNYVVHINKQAGKPTSFQSLNLPGAGAFIGAGSGSNGRVSYLRRADDGAIHAYLIDVGGKRFDSIQFSLERRLDIGLDGFYRGLVDASGALRAAMTVKDRKSTLQFRPANSRKWVPVKTFADDDLFEPVALSADGNSLYAKLRMQREQTDLVRMSLPSGEIAETVFSLPGVDIEGVVRAGGDGPPTAVVFFRDGKLETHYLEGAAPKLRGALESAFKGRSATVYDASEDGRLALVLVRGESDPGTYYLYDTQKRSVEELLPVVPAYQHARAITSEVLKVTMPDGLATENYLSLPTKGDKPYPLIVMPHGGPIGASDHLDFDPEVQLLANRGYAVLRVNYRGSGGFGRRFEQAGFGGWGKRIEDDILAALDAAIIKYPLDAQRVAVRGTSYGGYSTLMGLIRSPDRFRCGIAISAVTDLPLMFTSSDWSNDKISVAHMKEIVGDPTTGSAELEAVSPDFLYRKLTLPLLLVHGTDDQRVTLEHATRLRLLLKHDKRPPTWLEFAGEGHGVTKLDNRLKLEAAADTFLESCLAARVH